VGTDFGCALTGGIKLNFDKAAAGWNREKPTAAVAPRALSC